MNSPPFTVSGDQVTLDAGPHPVSLGPEDARRVAALLLAGRDVSFARRVYVGMNVRSEQVLALRRVALRWREDGALAWSAEDSPRWRQRAEWPGRVLTPADADAFAGALAGWAELRLAMGADVHGDPELLELRLQSALLEAHLGGQLCVAVDEGTYRGADLATVRRGILRVVLLPGATSSFARVHLEVAPGGWLGEVRLDRAARSVRRAVAVGVPPGATARHPRLQSVRDGMYTALLLDVSGVPDGPVAVIF